MTRARTVHLFALLLVPASVNCTAVPNPTAEGAVGTQNGTLYEGAGAGLWTQRGSYVPACWEMTQYSGYADVNSPQLVTWRSQVATAASYWSRTAGVLIGGWGACPTTGTSEFIRIQLFQAPNPTAAGDGGGAIIGTGGLVTPSTTQPCSIGSCLVPSVRFDLTSSTSQGRLEYLARHEFGHVLGFDHEQNSPLNGSTCPKDTGSSQSGVVLTAYDPDSIMNYCQAGGNVTGHLTALDVQGVRKAYQSPKVDINADTNTDLLFHNPTSGDMQAWFLSGVNRTAYNSIKEAATQLPLSVTAPWFIGAIGHFNNDTNSDIVFQNASTGELQVWMMWGTDRAAFVTPTDLTNGNTLSPGTLRLAGAADFDVDGDPDLLFYDNQSGQLQAWFMTGTGRKAFNLIKEHATQLPLSFSSPWRVGALGDFNADGLIDIAFQNVTTGEIQVWFMGGTDRTGYTSVKNQTTQATIFAPSPWMLNTAGDVDKDGLVDLIFRNTSTGEIQVWFMSGTDRRSFGSVKEQATGATLSAPAPWVLVGG